MHAAKSDEYQLEAARNENVAMQTPITTTDNTAAA